MPVLGEMNVEVNYGSQISKLTLTVVEGSGPSLFWKRLARTVAFRLENYWPCHAE